MCVNVCEFTSGQVRRAQKLDQTIKEIVSDLADVETEYNFVNTNTLLGS